jgi:hypothetical protein
MSRAFSYSAAVVCIAMLCGCRAGYPQPTSIETFRPATRADLNLGILSVSRDSWGFPLPIINLRSLTEDETTISYGPNSLTIHVGRFVASGPPATYDIRREILSSYGYMDFPPPSEGWAQIGADGKLQLLRPARLPPGNYDLWATFYTPDAGLLETPHQVYSNP